jgi:hypothetical protein
MAARSAIGSRQRLCAPRPDRRDAWYRSIVDGKGVRERWRALKIWRALWQTMIALGYCRKPDPSKAIRRETPTVRKGSGRRGKSPGLSKAHGGAAIAA